MKAYTSELEFLRDEVERCHASMHSQVETLKLLMEAHLELKKKVERQWVELTNEEIFEIHTEQADKVSWDGWHYERAIEAKLKEKNGG
jgi:hypothetical protein